MNRHLKGKAVCCPTCLGGIKLMGFVGKHLAHFRCNDCGTEFTD